MDMKNKYIKLNWATPQEVELGWQEVEFILGNAFWENVYINTTVCLQDFLTFLTFLQVILWNIITVLKYCFLF